MNMHIAPRDIARLVDEEPTDAEKNHLRTCEACRNALDDMQQSVRALGQLPRAPLPPLVWNRVQRERKTRAHSRGSSTHALRYAAALLLFAAGAASGAMSYAWFGAHRGADVSGSSTVSSTTNASMPSATLDAAEAQYQAAVFSYLENALAQRTLTNARLAALEGMVRTSDAALRDAPADPLIASYRRVAESARMVLWQRVAAQSAERWY